jgi:acetyltransferase-like isoleucine patch superfamily enzyme
MRDGIYPPSGLKRRDMSPGKITPPESLEKLFEIYPLLADIRLFNPYLIEPRDGRRSAEMSKYIEGTQRKLAEHILKNVKDSTLGAADARRIRPATEEEKKRYRELTTFGKLKVKNDMDFLSTGLPDAKVNHLRLLGASASKDAVLTYWNTIDTYFPEKITIGGNSILGMGSSIFTHEIVDGELYVGDVSIGKNVLISFGVVILPGTKIGDNAVVTPGILTSDVDGNTMASGLTGSERTRYGEKSKRKKGKKREVEDMPYDLRKWYMMLRDPVNFGLNNMFLEWQRVPTVNYEIRNRMLRWAGVKIGDNVKIESDVYFDSYFPERITIGDGTVIKRHTVLLTHEGLIGRVRTGDIKIGKNVVIESGCGILPGTEIGDNTKVYPYTLVNHSVPPNAKVTRDGFAAKNS